MINRVQSDQNTSIQISCSESIMISRINISRPFTTTTQRLFYMYLGYRFKHRYYTDVVRDLPMNCDQLKNKFILNISAPPFVIFNSALVKSKTLCGVIGGVFVLYLCDFKKEILPQLTSSESDNMSTRTPRRESERIKCTFRKCIRKIAALLFFR